MGIFNKKQATPLPEPINDPNLSEFRQRLDDLRLPENLRASIAREIDKVAFTDASMVEYSLGLNYIEFLLTLPWTISSADNLDLSHAKAVLEAEHYGLSSVKERVLEYLAYNISCQIRRKLILIIDNSEKLIQQITACQAVESCEILQVASYDEALAVLVDDHVDCIFCEWSDAEGTTQSFLDDIKMHWPSVPIVVTSKQATVDEAVAAMRKGAAHYLKTPIDQEGLNATIADLLGQTTASCSVSGPILCFTGPPGTGKTSIGRSIASALQRKFIRLSLAGMRDEAELRGHRRTYVGAMTGRIISEIHKHGVNNPVFMLDEIDKMGQDFRGDPASVLLEILDPEQNRLFLDYYLDLPFDLTRVMFITTANSIDNLPGPLRDRMESVAFPSYTLGEKRKIAFNYLFPRQVRSTCYSISDITLQPDAIDTIILEYARGAGLRGLNREIGAICRKVNLKIMEKEFETPVVLDANGIRKLLGHPKFRLEAATARALPGVTTGLVWSESGGHIIFIESAIMQGTGKLIMTGSLGRILRESAQTALSFLRSNASNFNIDEEFFDGNDIHVHIPAGAVTKDGPSAGTTIVMALISLLTGRPARRDVALTGEFTLSGRLLPVSRLREKILAAQQAGVCTVILPARNKEEVGQMEEEIRDAVQLVFASSINEVVDIVLMNHCLTNLPSLRANLPGCAV